MGRKWITAALDIAVIVLLLFSAYNYHLAKQADDRTNTLAMDASKLSIQNCYTLREGRQLANSRNEDVIKFLIELTPKGQLNDPQTQHTLSLARALFKTNLPIPSCQ